MALYAAISLLKSKIRGYLRHYDACFEPQSLDLVQYLYKEVVSFQGFLENLDRSSRKRMNASLPQIAEAIRKFHDLLWWHLSEQSASARERRKRMLGLGPSLEEENEVNRTLGLGLSAEEVNRILALAFSGEEDGEKQLILPPELPEKASIEGESSGMLLLIDLRIIRRDIHSFLETLKKVQEEYKEQEDESSSRIDFRGNKRGMVGLLDQHTQLKEDIVRDWGGAVKLLSIIGMAGIGKTTLARKIFEDLDIAEWFDCRVWVAVGREWLLPEIVRSIVAQVELDCNEEMFNMEEEYDGRMNEFLKECLKGKRFLIVLDDVWDVQVWHDVSKLLKTTTQNVVGCRVLLTSRMQDVVDDAGLNSGVDSLDMRLLNKEESWDLLREKVFGLESCSFQLEKTGRKIAEKCDGLPLTIIAVAELLSEAEKTPEYWNEVATQEKHPLFAAAYDEVSKVLYPSYENLPQHLKMCFLYMGVFPLNDKIRSSKVVSMWIAEGLVLEPNTAKSSKEHAVKCLVKLASNNVVVYQRSTVSSSRMSIADVVIKVCSLHSSWWHLCYREARKNNFFHILNNLDDSLGDSIKGQSRLSIHKNILLGMREVYESMEENCASSAESLLFYGTYHKYPIQICSAFKLLRVLDALMIRFYEFPLQVLELVELKYLALALDGMLPPSISKLHKLQFLIVTPHQRIKSCGAMLYLPLGIWDIKELQHLQVMGSDLPDFWGSPLPNLSTLLDVSSLSCTKAIFERIPNLKKLGIQIELPPDYSGEPMTCFDHVSILTKLKSLKCGVVNPELTYQLVPPPTVPILPSRLEKLALSGMGYPWAEMSKIASLEKLKVLKLRCNAFQGPKWEVEENTFSALEYLLIEDSDLEHWKVGRGNFRWLEHLSIKHCYKLTELDWECDDNISMVEVEDCDPLVFKQIKEAKWRKGMLALDLHVHSSWNDKS